MCYQFAALSYQFWLLQAAPPSNPPASRIAENMRFCPIPSLLVRRFSAFISLSIRDLPEAKDIPPSILLVDSVCHVRGASTLNAAITDTQIFALPFVGEAIGIYETATLRDPKSIECVDFAITPTPYAHKSI